MHTVCTFNAPASDLLWTIYGPRSSFYTGATQVYRRFIATGVRRTCEEPALNMRGIANVVQV